MVKHTRLVAAAAAVVIGVAGSGARAADDVADDPFAGLPSHALLVGVNMAARPSPSNCVGQAELPEPFGNNEVEGAATTRCDRFVPQISVQAQLWERRIWGMDRVGTPGDESEIDESDIAAVAFGDCRTNTMRTTGRHAATDVDFNEYRARTNSGTTPITC